MSNGTFSSRTITRLTNWCGRRGQRALPEFYFLPTTILTIVLFISFIYGFILYGVILAIVRFSMQDMLMIVIQPATFWDNVGIVSFITVSSLLFFVLMYLRQMTAYTLKTKLKIRTLILHRTPWKKLATYSFFGFYLISNIFALVYSLSMDPPTILENELMSKILTFLTPIFPSYFSFFVTLTILFLLFAILLSSGVSIKEKIEIIANSLTRIDVTKEFEAKKLKEIEYLSKEFVRNVSLSLLTRNQFLEEVKFGEQLGPLFLALIYGESQEKDNANQLLSEIECDSKNILHYNQFLINWILKVSCSFPRFVPLKNSLVFKSKMRNGFISSDYESLKFIATISTIVGLIVAVITLAIQLL